MRSIWHTALAKALNSSPFCETTQFFFLPISVLYQHTCQLYASEAHAEEMKMPHCLERFSQKEVSQALRLHHETCFRPFGFPEPSFFSIFELFFFFCLPLFSVLCCSFFFLWIQVCVCVCALLVWTERLRTLKHICCFFFLVGWPVDAES